MKPKRYMRLVKEMASAGDTKKEARKSAKYFTRERKLPFSDVVCLLLDMQKTALQARLNHFFKSTGQEKTMTEQALSKARNHFDHSPFEKMVRITTAEEYAQGQMTPKWNGYYVLGVDGTSEQVPDTAKTRKHFGVLGSNGGHACVGCSILYDLENTWVMDPIFTPVAMDERAQLVKHIGFLEENYPHVAKDALILLDRGYPSAKVFEEMERVGIKYICRCSRSFFPSVNAAPIGDTVVEHGGMKLRVYKFDLSSGEEETLVSNLFDVEGSEFRELYAKRWGIETAYATLKNKLCVENFSGKTVNSIYQDLWASMVLMNMVSVIEKEADGLVKEKRQGKSNKYEYAPNKGALIVSLRDEFIFCCLRENVHIQDIRLDELMHEIARCVLPIRPGRSSPRPPRSKTNLRFPVNNKSHL